LSQQTLIISVVAAKILADSITPMTCTTGSPSESIGMTDRTPAISIPCGRP